MTVRTILLMTLGAVLCVAADREVTGRVVDANTGEPIAHAHLTMRLYQAGSQATEVSILSDADGSFKITNMPASGYQLSVQKNGYLPANQGQPAPPPEGTTAPIVLRMTAQAALEGTVVDEQDNPMPNASIQLIRQQVVNGRRQYVSVNASSTDESGYFRMFGLPAGRYYVGIGARFNPSRGKVKGYQPQYFPKATDIAGAQAIDLKAGDNQQIQAHMSEPVPTYEVRGVVVSGSSNISVGLSRAGGSQAPSPISLGSNWDPKTHVFKFPNVPAGLYEVYAYVQDGKNQLQARATVAVGNADISGIQLEPAETKLEGTLRVESSASAPKTMFVSLQGSRYNSGAQVDPDGKFQFGNLQPDTYRVLPQVNGAQCIGSILQGGRDVRGGLTVSADAPPAPVEIVVTDHCGKIEATLSVTDSAPATGLTAVLLRKIGDEFAMEKQAGMFLRGRGTAPLFEFQGVTPGDYVLFVWPQDAQVEYANADYMRQFESYGQTVTVTDGATLAVTVDKVMPNPAKN